MRVCYSEIVKQDCSKQLSEVMSRLQTAQKALQNTLEQELTRTQYEYFNKKTCETVAYLERCAKAVASGQTALPMEVFAKSCELHETAQAAIQQWCEDLRSEIREKQCSFDIQALKAIPVKTTDIKETDFDLVVKAFQSYANELKEIASQWESRWLNENDNALTRHFGTYMSKTCFLPQAKAAERGSTFVTACRDHFVQELRKTDVSFQAEAQNAGTAAKNAVTEDNNTGNGTTGSSGTTANQGNVGIISGATPNGNPGSTQSVSGTSLPVNEARGNPGQGQERTSSTDGNGSSVSAGSGGNENQSQDDDYIRLNWNQLNGYAKKIKLSQDLDERFECFRDFYKAIYIRTEKFTVQLSNANEACSPEMGRLLAATRYALTNIGQPFLRLSKGINRASWWNKSWKDTLVTCSRRLNMAVDYCATADNVERISELSGVSDDELEYADSEVKAGKYRPAQIIGAIKLFSPGRTLEECFKSQKPEPYKHWQVYSDYEKLIDMIENKETVGMGLHILSYILHDNIRYIQYGAHTTSMLKVGSYIGKGNEADQHIAFQYASFMAAMSHFANILLDTENDNSEELFYNSQNVNELTKGKILDGGILSAKLNKKNIAFLMQLDSPPSKSDDITVVATEIFRIIRKYRFALKNEKKRDEMSLAQFDMGIDIAVDAVKSLAEILHAGAKLVPGGDRLLKTVLGPMEMLVSLTEHCLKGEVLSAFSDAADMVPGIKDTGNKMLQAIQRLLEVYKWGRAGKQVGTIMLNEAQISILMAARNDLLKYCEEIQEQLKAFEKCVQNKRQDLVNKRMEGIRQEHLNEIRTELSQNPQNSAWNDAIRVAFTNLETIKEPKNERDQFYPEELCYIPKRYWWVFDQIAAAYLASVRWKKEHPGEPDWAQEKKAEEALRGILGAESGQTCVECSALDCVFHHR